MRHSFRFYQNKDCKYFPCHENIDVEAFNCLFCYCPLYFLGTRCGGNFFYCGKNNHIKNCEKCLIPHEADNYDLVVGKLHSAIEAGASKGKQLTENV